MQAIDYPKLEVQDVPGVHPDNVGRKPPHGAILKIVAANLCGSDQHMVRGRTTAPVGLILGHTITGDHGCVSAGVTTGSTVYIAGRSAWPRLTPHSCWAPQWSSSAT